MSYSGVFNIDDINFLRDNQQYPSLGQLELIQTQTVSSVAARALNEWLRENFSKEIESFNQVQNLIQEESNAETI